MNTVNLTDHFLIAMPHMEDPYFAKSLAYVCDHGAAGAIGVVVNRPIDLDMQALFDQLGIELKRPDLAQQPVYFGGPVQMDRGFVLHQPKGEWQSVLPTQEHIGLTTSKDILQAVGDGDGPQHVLVTLGYAGWEAGQLEQEIADNAWLTVAADPKLIFSLPPEDRLAAAMAKLGVDPLMLSDAAGHA